MPAPRSRIVDEAVTPWYHCISRCVRRAFLCGPGSDHRKRWIVDRIEALVGIFAVDCAGFAVLDNHLHVLVRLDSPAARDWPAHEVARRWLTLFPLRDTAGHGLPVSQARVERLAQDAGWVSEMRGRLSSLSWFMKCLKEPLARMANKEDGCSGAFWEGRFKSIAVLDQEGLLATAAYIDLNPMAAGLAATPEGSSYTSLRTRLDECRADGTLASLRDDLSTRTCDPEQEAGSWLMPIDDHRPTGEGRVGMIAGFTLSCYLRLVDAAGRVLRDGKASLGPELGPIFQRLGIDQEIWHATLVTLLTRRGRIPSRLGEGSPSRDRFGPGARARFRTADHRPRPSPHPAPGLAGV